jgi:hypothetical protein
MVREDAVRRATVGDYNRLGGQQRAVEAHHYLPAKYTQEDEFFIFLCTQIKLLPHGRDDVHVGGKN